MFWKKDTVSRMDATSEMEDIRRRIRTALDQSPDKSQKELAKLLDISPAQITSLLRPGGRWLQAPELPIVESYLGISLVRRPRFPRRFDPSGAPPKPPKAVAPSLSDIVTPEGSHVAFAQTHPDVVRYLKSVADTRPAELWRINTDLVQEAGYLPGDYAVIDRKRSATAGDVVLAEVRAQAGEWIPIFRVFRPPSLRTANSQYIPARLPIADSAIAVIGPIVASVRDSRTLDTSPEPEPGEAEE